MENIKINVFIPLLSLPVVEEELKSVNVAGITISKVKGYGQHMNYYSSDWLDTHARVEIFCERKDKNTICAAIKKGVGNPELNNGFVVIQPVEDMFPLSNFGENEQSK